MYAADAWCAQKARTLNSWQLAYGMEFHYDAIWADTVPRQMGALFSSQSIIVEHMKIP